MYTTVGTFLQGNLEIRDPLPASVCALMTIAYGTPVPENSVGVSTVMDMQAMTWHGMTPKDILRATASMDIMALPVWENGMPLLFITMQHLLVMSQDAGERWHQPLPLLESLVQRNWPCIADIFCASRVHARGGGLACAVTPESSSIHGIMRLPTFSKEEFDDLLQWATAGAHRGSSDTAALQRMRKVRTAPGGASTTVRRRRGVRKWVVASVGTLSTSSTVPGILLQLMEWLLCGLQRASFLEGEACLEEHWLTTPVDVLITSSCPPERNATASECPPERHWGECPVAFHRHTHHTGGAKCGGTLFPHPGKLGRSACPASTRPFSACTTTLCGTCGVTPSLCRTCSIYSCRSSCRATLVGFPT
jgi:hypothetical protein